MSNQARFGFTPVQGPMSNPRKYTLASAYAPGNSCVGVAPGDVVKGLTDGTVALYEVGDGANVLLGVIAAVSYVGTDGRRVYGGYVPAGHTYTGDADVINPLAPWILVWDQPNTEFIASLTTDSGTALTEFQKNMSNMEVSATSSTSVDTYYKRSKRTLTGTAATTNTLPFRVTEILRSPSQDYAAASNLRVKCVMNAGLHPFYNPLGL